MSPRNAETNRALREASRARILRHALKLFGRRGYAATPVDAIARAARISPGLLYHYFPSKLALLRALFEESMHDVLESFARADAEPVPAKRLGALFLAIADIVKAHRDFWALSYGVRMQRDVLAALGPNVQASAALILAVLERYLREAGWPDPKLEAALLFAQIDGMHQHYVLDPDNYPLNTLVDRLTRRYAAPPSDRSRRDS